MGRVGKFSRNWPDNGVTNATRVNDIYADIETQSGEVNNGNVRTEGIDARNFGANVNVKWGGSQFNDYEPALGTTPIPVATNYGNFANDAVRESPINHNISGLATTIPGYGTKLIVGDGTNGIGLVTNDIVRIKWTVNIFKVRPQLNPSGVDALLCQHASQLITNVARPDGSTNGSGVGEWCYLIYPKVNTTSNANNDADFKTVSTANMYYATVIDPSTATTGMTKNYQAAAFFPHCSVVDMCTLTQGTSDDDPGYTFSATGDDATSGGVRRPYSVSGCITLKANTAMTLYGIQLYTSGVWRMDGNTSNAFLYLEDQTCDGTLGTPTRGVSMSVCIGEAEVSAIIHTNSHTP